MTIKDGKQILKKITRLIQEPWNMHGYLQLYATGYLLEDCYIVEKYQDERYQAHFGVLFLDCMVIIGPF